MAVARTHTEQEALLSALVRLLGLWRTEVGRAALHEHGAVPLHRRRQIPQRPQLQKELVPIRRAKVEGAERARGRAGAADAGARGAAAQQGGTCPHDTCMMSAMMS